MIELPATVARTRFDNGAWTLGGPVRLPGVPFNRGRNKLFFFFSQDRLARTDPGTLKTCALPLIFAIGITPGGGIDSPSLW